MKISHLINENIKTGTFYYSPGKDKLPEDMIKLFSDLAEKQRNVPETVMYNFTYTSVKPSDL